MLDAYFGGAAAPADKRKPAGPGDKKPKAGDKRQARPRQQPAKPRQPARPKPSEACTTNLHAAFEPLPRETGEPKPFAAASSAAAFDDVVDAQSAAGEWDYVWEEVDAAAEDDCETDYFEDETPSELRVGDVEKLEDIPPTPESVAEGMDILERHFLKREKELFKKSGSAPAAAAAVYAGPELCMDDDDFIF